MIDNTLFRLNLNKYIKNNKKKLKEVHLGLIKKKEIVDLKTIAIKKSFFFKQVLLLNELNERKNFQIFYNNKNVHLGIKKTLKDIDFLSLQLFPEFLPNSVKDLEESGHYLNESFFKSYDEEFLKNFGKKIISKKEINKYLKKNDPFDLRKILFKKKHFWFLNKLFLKVKTYNEDNSLKNSEKFGILLYNKKFEFVWNKKWKKIISYKKEEPWNYYSIFDKVSHSHGEWVHDITTRFLSKYRVYENAGKFYNAMYFKLYKNIHRVYYDIFRQGRAEYKLYTLIYNKYIKNYIWYIKLFFYNKYLSLLFQYKKYIRSYEKKIHFQKLAIFDLKRSYFLNVYNRCNADNKFIYFENKHNITKLFKFKNKFEIFNFNKYISKLNWYNIKNSLFSNLIIFLKSKNLFRLEWIYVRTIKYLIHINKRQDSFLNKRVYEIFRRRFRLFTYKYRDTNMHKFKYYLNSFEFKEGFKEDSVYFDYISETRNLFDDVSWIKYIKVQSATPPILDYIIKKVNNYLPENYKNRFKYLNRGRFYLNRPGFEFIKSLIVKLTFVHSVSFFEMTDKYKILFIFNFILKKFGLNMWKIYRFHFLNKKVNKIFLKKFIFFLKKKILKNCVLFRLNYFNLTSFVFPKMRYISTKSFAKFKLKLFRFVRLDKNLVNSYVRQKFNFDLSLYIKKFFSSFIKNGKKKIVRKMLVKIVCIIKYFNKINVMTFFKLFFYKLQPLVFLRKFHVGKKENNIPFFYNNGFIKNNTSDVNRKFSSLLISWLIKSIRNRKEKNIFLRIVSELLDVLRNKGNTIELKKNFYLNFYKSKTYDRLLKFAAWI